LAQSPSLAQVARHVLVLGSQAYEPQATAVVARQAPAPLQRWPFSCCDAAQVSAGHSLSGSLPSAIGPQVPSAPDPFLVAVQARQSSVHALSQQTPSTQWALAQSTSALQGSPLARARSKT
jgi:hypothetical protein